MSKSNAKDGQTKEQPVIDLLVETSPQAAALIMKRRKLLRTGGSLHVGRLMRHEGHTWLKATVPVDDGSHNPWDLAHETAARCKRDLGQMPYVEPDRVGGQYDVIARAERARDGSSAAGAAGGNGDDAGGALGSADPFSMSGMGLDHNDILRSVMPDLSAFGMPQMGLPSAGMSQRGGRHGFGPGSMPGVGGAGFGMPGSGMHGIGSFGMDPFAAPGIGRGRSSGSRASGMPGVPGLPDLSSLTGLPAVPGLDVPGITDGDGEDMLGDSRSDGEAREHAVREITVPALALVPGWDDLHPVLARMLTVETAQLLLSQMPGVSPAVHGVSSLRAVGRLPQCSRALRSILQRLPEPDEGEFDGYPIEPAPPPPKTDGIALELPTDADDELACEARRELVEA